MSCEFLHVGFIMFCVSSPVCVFCHQTDRWKGVGGRGGCEHPRRCSRSRGEGTTGRNVGAGLSAFFPSFPSVVFTLGVNPQLALSCFYGAFSVQMFNHSPAAVTLK